MIMATAVHDDNFQLEVLDFDGTVLVDFYADWCGPCQAMLPLVTELSDEVDEKQKVVKVNVDNASAVAGKYGIMSIPAFKAIRGGKVVAEAVGVQSKEQLLAMLAA